MLYALSELGVIYSEEILHFCKFFSVFFSSIYIEPVIYFIYQKVIHSALKLPQIIVLLPSVKFIVMIFSSSLYQEFFCFYYNFGLCLIIVVPLSILFIVSGHWLGCSLLLWTILYSIAYKKKFVHFMTSFLHRITFLKYSKR